MWMIKCVNNGKITLLTNCFFFTFPPSKIHRKAPLIVDPSVLIFTLHFIFYKCSLSPIPKTVPGLRQHTQLLSFVDYKWRTKDAPEHLIKSSKFCISGESWHSQNSVLILPIWNSYLVNIGRTNSDHKTKNDSNVIHYQGRWSDFVW